MASFAGLRGTGDWGTDERPKNFRELILWSNPNGSAPLYALMAKMKKEAVNDPEFAWFEEKLTPVRITTNADMNTTSTAGSTASGALQLVVGDVMLVEKTETATYDNEIVVVASVTNDTTFTVTRAQAGSSGAGIASGSFLTKIGNVFQEGSSAPTPSLRNPTKLKNYTQIFRTAVGTTNTAKATKTRTGDSYANDKKRKAFDHSSSIEFGLMFGRPYEDLTGTKPKRYMGGLRSFISTNVKVFTTTPTEDTFFDAIYPVFNYSTGGAGDERIVLAGNGFLNSLNKLARNSTRTQIQFNGVINVYGMKLQEWILPQGRLAVKTHPLMNLHGRFTNSAFIIDPTGLIWRPLSGRDTKFKDNIQANDEDAQRGEWFTEAGFEVHHEETMGYLGNFVV